jgi:3-phenylpropionate/trans-cinnamate dioxygenase ferredoxin reductase subunit
MKYIDNLIIGGGLAGGYAAISLRQNDLNSSVLIITAEQHLPYDRVPLSKDFLQGKVKRESLFIRKPDFYEKNKIEILTGKKVIDLEIKNNIAVLEDNTEIKFGKLLIATGGYPRKLNIEGSNKDNVFYLRNIEDSEKIRSAAINSKKAVIIGGGFIGCEIASSLKKIGLDVTIIEKANSILTLALDEETAKLIEEYFRKMGINIITGTSIKQFITKENKAIAVETETGKIINGDIFVVGIGIKINNELAEKAGININNGIIVNESLKTNYENVFAVGDVANFYHPLYETNMRVEHYDVAVRHGKIAGSNMAGLKASYTELPYFFSYMYNLNIYSWGMIKGYDYVVKRGELNVEKGFLQFYFKKGQMIAVLGVNTFKETEYARKIIQNKKTIENPDLLSDKNVDLKNFV